MEVYKIILLTAMLSTTLIFSSCGLFTPRRYIDESTARVEDVFVVGDDFDIDLSESKLTYAVQPGAEIYKDPRVTVRDDMGGCWLFIKVESELPDYVKYEIDHVWTRLPDFNDVFYIKDPGLGSFPVLEDDRVTVDSDINNVSDSDGKVMNLTAYAIQLDAANTPRDAWRCLINNLE